MFNPFAPDNEDENEPDPFGRVMPKQELDPVLKNLRNPTELSGSVGETGKNERPDVAKIENMLGKAKTLDLKKTDGPTGYWGERTREATPRFRKRTA